MRIDRQTPFHRLFFFKKFNEISSSINGGTILWKRFVVMTKLYGIKKVTAVQGSLDCVNFLSKTGFFPGFY